MVDLAEQILFIRRGVEVKRFHSLVTIQQETVGHHSCGVALMVWLLTEGRCSVALLMSALTHDLPEQHTGDIPAPMKRRFNLSESFQLLDDKYLTEMGLFYHLTDVEKRILKLADVLDGALFCIREKSLGNQTIRIIYERYMVYCENLNPVYREAQIFSAIKQLWKEVQ